MKTGSNFLYIFLTLYKSTLAVNVVTQYHVNALNHIFDLPGWKILTRYDGFEIVDRRTAAGTAESVLSAKDILETDDGDDDGRVVTGENAGCKIRQAHQLLSCQYASSLKLCYHYNIGAIIECTNIRDPSGSSECVTMSLAMIKKIDEMVVRMLGTLSCIYEVFPITTYDKQVFEAMEDFKRFYDHLYFDRTSLDKKYHDAIITSTMENMNTAFRHLRGFYDKFCRPNEDEGTSKITNTVLELDQLYPPLYVMNRIKNWLDVIVNVSVNNLWVSVGFEYDTELKKSRITYEP